MEINDKLIMEFSEDFKKIEQEIKKCIFGQDEIIRNVLICIIAGGNVLLEGLPGLGKTKLIKTIGDVLDMSFSRVQFTPDLMPADITGTNIIVKDENGLNKFEFQKGPIFSNIVLADEINRATPKTQSALLEAMQEKTVTSGNNTYKLPEPFFVLATQNPVEMDGTYPLPEAQVDRFMFKLDVSYPSKDDLIKIISDTTKINETVPDKITDKEKILAMREISKQVPISTPVLEYVSEIILKSNPESDLAPDYVKQYVRYGSSPRGAQAIVLSSKINALINGRYNVSYDDVKEMSKSALRHRLILNFEAVTDGISEEEIINKITERQP